MAQKNINLGSANYAGDGESLRSAFEKIQDNFSEIYLDLNVGGQIIIKDVHGDLNGSVFADDSTLLIDGQSGKIQTSKLSSENANTGDALVWNGTQWGPQSISGAPLTRDLKGSLFADDSSLLIDGINGIHYGRFDGILDGEMNGSVFADNSTLLVDGVNGTIPSVDKLLADIKTAAATSINFADFQSKIAAL